jgi:hypothetical protein
MKYSFKRFLLCWAATVGGALLLIAALNLAVDPLCIYRLPVSASLDAFKDQRSRRVAQAEDLRAADPTLLLLGSSRLGEGVRADHPAFAGQRVFKLALFGTNMEECADAFDYAIDHKPHIHQAIFLIDFMMFSERAQGAPDFVHPRFDPSCSVPEYYLKGLLGCYATRESLLTLDYRLRGQLPLKTIDQFAAELGNRSLMRKTMARACGTDGVYRDFAYGGRTLSLFTHILHACREHRIDLKLAISPAHVVDLECIRAQGLWPTYERWERDLVRIVGQESPAGHPFALWDFTGFDGPTAEPIPPLADRSHRMTWYYENSHFTPALGDAMIDRMFDSPQPPGITGSFGVNLAAANLPLHLADLRRQRETYVRQYPAELAFVLESTNPAPP